jgi:hypothetical protein
MTETSGSKSAPKLEESRYPWCLRCNKRVDFVAVSPEPRREGNFIVEYRCHGESVSQEMEAFEINDGLASYTAFNAYTSGLLPDLGAIEAAKKGETE